MPTNNDNEPIVGTLYVNGKPICGVTSFVAENDVIPLMSPNPNEAAVIFVAKMYANYDLQNFVEEFRDALFGGSVWRKE